MILLKRVYEKFNVVEGRRILVDRLWPRGIRRNTPNVDIWLKNVAPSNELRKWFGHNPRKWGEFKRLYAKELKDNKTVEQVIDIIRSTDPVTFVYASKDEVHNNAVVLRNIIEQKMKRDKNNGHSLNLKHGPVYITG